MWGLISCHGRDPRIVPFDVRATCELFGQVLSLQIATREQAAKLAYRNQLNSVLTRLMSSMTRQQDIFSSLRGQSADWLALTNATGAALLLNDRLEVTGRTPTKAQIVELAEWLHQHAKGDVTAFEKLAEAYPRRRRIHQRGERPVGDPAFTRASKLRAVVSSGSCLDREVGRQSHQTGGAAGQ